jgi:hypothetical protein
LQTKPEASNLLLKISQQNETAIHFSRDFDYYKKRYKVFGSINLIAAVVITLIKISMWWLPLTIAVIWGIAYLREVAWITEIALDKDAQVATFKSSYKLFRLESTKQIPYSEVQGVYCGYLPSHAENNPGKTGIYLYTRDERLITILNSHSSAEIHCVTKSIEPYLVIKDENGIEHSLIQQENDLDDLVLTKQPVPDDNKGEKPPSSDGKKETRSRIICLAPVLGCFTIMIIFMYYSLLPRFGDAEFTSSLCLLSVYLAVLTTILLMNMQGMFKERLPGEG